MTRVLIGPPQRGGAHVEGWGKSVVEIFKNARIDTKITAETNFGMANPKMKVPTTDNENEKMGGFFGDSSKNAIKKRNIFGQFLFPSDNV